MKLETIIESETNERIYVSFPISRRELREKLKKINATPDSFQVCGVKVGNNDFGKAVLRCTSLDILNYLGYWMSQFSENEYYLFFEFLNAGMAWGQDIDDYINAAANIKSFYRIDNIQDYYALGKWCLNEYFSRHKELSIEDFDTSYQEVETLGMQYASDRLGKFFEGSFYGCLPSFELIYTDENDIPKDLLVSPLRINAKDLG